MAAVAAIGAVVRLDPRPAVRLGELERIAQEEPGSDGESLLDEYAAGKWALACLHCWVEAAWPDGRFERRDGIVVDNVWIRVGDAGATMRHAGEMFANTAPERHADLRRCGVEIDYDAFAELIPEIELDADVQGLVARRPGSQY